MSMTEQECLHDCTCHRHSVPSPESGQPELDCDLPEGHVGKHWDPAFGFFSE
jgi:hypothetical protein